jgi:hypothetical protein
MPETFGSRLKQFALAVDIVDEEVLHETFSLIVDYLRAHLRPKYWALLTERTVNKQPGLFAHECSTATKPAFSLRTDAGAPNGLAAYSYVEGKKMWIVGADRQAIGPDTPLRDEWGAGTDLPAFDRSASEGIKTVLLIPLCSNGRKVGLLDFQSSGYQELTPRIEAEVLHLAETLAVLLPLYEVNQARREHTRDAIKLHQKALNEEQWPPLTKPQIFVASSDRADPAVMGVIREELDRCRDHLLVHYWKESSDSGNINSAILKQIHEAQFGLCYFSEPVQNNEGDPLYHDNPNVVFEAGMLHAHTNRMTDAPMAWIPIREASSPPAPFDFAQERMIIVKRLGPDHRPNLDALRGDLAGRLAALLERTSHR